MLKFKIFVISALLCIFSIAQGHATGLLRVTECTNPKGSFYDLHANDKKWTYDDSVKMSVSILTEHEAVHDIVIKDGVGESTIKHSSRGYYFVPRSEKRFTILVDTTPLGIFEIFQLEYNDNNSASLIYTIMKNGTPPHNSSQVSTYILSCKY
jgi:hypothetical protein